MATENKIAEAVTMESEGEKRSITCDLLDPILNKFSLEEPKKSPGMQDLPAEITELLIKAEDVQSIHNFAESTRADRKDIDGASEGEKFLELSSEAAIVEAEDNKQLQRAETLETDESTTDEKKHFQEEKSDQDYDTENVTSAVSHVAKTVEANFNIIEEQRTEEVLEKNVDTGCGPEVDCTDNVANMDPTFVSQNVGESIFDEDSKVSEKLLHLPAEQKAPQSLDTCKQTEDEKVEIDKIIQNGARDASIAAVAASSDTPNDDREFTIISDEGEKKPDESSTVVAADMSMKHEHEVDIVELKETTSTGSQDMTELSAETKHVMPAGENKDDKSNSTGSAVIIESVAHSSHQIDEEVARHMDVEEANDLTQETITQVVQNTLAEDGDGMDRKENLDSSSAKHVESMQRDYSNPFSTEASEGERNDSGYLTGEVVMDVSGQGITDAKDHIAKEISSVKAESEGSFLQQSLPGNEQPEVDTEVLHKAVSCIKEEAHSKSCEGGFTQKLDEDKSVDNWPNDEEIQENSPLNPEGDQQRSEAADLEIEREKVTGEWEACKPKEKKTEDGSEACKSTELQDAGHPSREGHDPEDVSTDIAASGDIHCTESVADEILQPTSEPEIVLETAPTCRAEHDSCCGEKEKATEAEEYKELTAKSCNTTDLTEETIRTSPAENSDTTQKENKCEIKLSEESEPAGADRSLADDTPQDNESSEMSLQISPPMHGEMTQEVEGKEKGTSAVILADDSSITGLDKVIEEASTPEKDSEETVNKNEGANEFKRSLDEIPEPTEAVSTNSPQTGGTILCHEELSAKGNNEDNVKYEQNEINKIYEQTGRSSTTEGLEDLILLKDNKETGESTGPDLIEEDPIQERTTKAIAHREDNVMGCQINPSTEEAIDYTKNISEETNATRDFEVLAEGVSEGRPSKDDREEENNEEVHAQLVTFTSCEKTDDCEREGNAKSKLSPAVDEQEIENQKSKFMSDAISLKEEGKDAKDFTEQVEAARSIETTANTEKGDTETCNKIQSTSIDECSEKETLPMEHDEYYQSGSPCSPPETNSEVNGAAERLEVPSANGSQAARVSAIEDAVPANDNESEAKIHAGSTDIAFGVDELPTLANQERRLENTESSVNEDDLTDSGQEKQEIPASADAIKESTESEILDKEPKDSKDLGTTEKTALETAQGSLCSILKTEAGVEECEASAEYEGPDKNEEHLYGTHSIGGVLMPQEDESAKTVSESKEVETAKGSAQKEVSEDLHVPPEVPFADLNIAEGRYISATNGTGETETQIQEDQHNAVSDERFVNTHLEMKEFEGETHDEALQHQELFAPEKDIKSRTPEETVSTENDEDNLKEDYVPDKAAFHSEVSTPIGEEMGSTISTQNLKTMELTEQTETMNMEIDEHPRSERETCIAGEVEEEAQYKDNEDPVGLIITPTETIKEYTIKEPDSGINRDIAAAEIGQEEVRPQKEQLDDRPNMASDICSDMGPPERTETDHSKHGEEVDGTKCHEISTNLLPKSSESDSMSAEREITVVENPAGEDNEDPVGLVISPMETIKEDTIKEPDSGINRDIAAAEIGQEEVRPQKEQLDDRPNMASDICLDMGPPERTETDHSKHGEEVDGTKCHEISTNLLPKSSESDSMSAERELTVVENPAGEDNEDPVGLVISPMETIKEDTIKEPDSGINRDIAAAEIGQEEVRPQKEQLDDRPNMASDICSDMGPPERTETDHSKHGEEVDGTKCHEISTNLLPKSSESDSMSAEREITVVENPAGEDNEDPVGLVITPMETIKEDTIKEPDSGINRDIAAAEIGQVEVRPQKEQLDDRPNMASDICSDMGPPERAETDHSKHGEEVDGTKCQEISTNLLPKSSESDSMSAEREITVVENPTITEEEIELPSDKKDEARASDAKESTERENCSSIENTDAEETEKHEEFSERLATSATQDGEAAEDGNASDQTIPRESTLELLTPVSVSLLEEKENGPKAADEKIKDDNEEEVEMQLNESLQLSSGTVQKDEACFDKKEPNKDGASKIGHDDSEGEKDTPNGQKDGCTHGEEVLKVETQENKSKTTNPDSPEVNDTTAEVSVITEEASHIISSEGENVHEVAPDVQTNESFTRLDDVDLKGMKVEATIADVEPEQKCEDAIEANDMSQNAITDEAVLHGQLKAEETQNEEELETGEGDKKLLLESCKIVEMNDFVPVSEDTQAIDQAEQAQAGNADNEEIQICKIENDDESISPSKTADTTKDIEKEVVKETSTLDDFNAPTTAAVETAEIGIPAKEASSGVFNENVHEVMSDVQENGSSIELEHGEMKGMKVEAVTADVKPEEKCEDANGANDMSQNGITNEGEPDENKKSEETQNGEQRENGEGDIKISEKKDYFGPILAEDTEEIDQDEQEQAGTADKEQICDELKDSISVSKTEDPIKDFDEIVKKTDTLDELNATTIAAVEIAAEISIPREEASGVMFRKGEHMHEVMSDVQTNESSIGSEDAEMNAMKVEAVAADVEPAEKCEDGIEEIDMSQSAITNEGMTDAHMKAPLLESCNISEKKDFGKALAEVTEATDQIELAKAGHADNEEIQTSESKIHDRLKDSVSVSKTEDATKDVEKEIITEAGTTDEFNATTFIAVPETTEIKIPTEEASGFVLSKSENTSEVVTDVQANESSMGSEDAETKGTQVEEVMADVKPEEKRENAIEANNMSQNLVTSEGVLDSPTKAGGEENETREGDNGSLLGSCKINEMKDFGPVVAEDTEAAEKSENADNEEVQTSKSKTDDKLEDSVLVWKTADATKDVGKKIIEEVDTPDEFNAMTIAAAETEIALREPQEEETPVRTSTVPPDSVTVQNSNADDFERIGMVSELSHDSNSAYDETIDGAEKTPTNEKLGLVENEAESEGSAHQVTVSKTDQGKTVFREETTADQILSARKQESLVQTPVFASLPGGGEENIEKVENIEGYDKVVAEIKLKENLELSSFAEKTHTECLERGEPRNPEVTELEISVNESTQDTNEDEKEQNTYGEALKAAPEEKEKETEFADSPLSSIKNKELSGPHEKASDVMFKTRETAQVDLSEVQTMKTFEESEDGENQDVNLEAVAVSEPAEQSEDAIVADMPDNVEQEMQNEREKADGSEEINEQETMKDVDSKETRGTTPGNSIINKDMHTGSISAGEITHCDEQTNAEKPESEKNLASKSESYATVALEIENILNGGGIYIAQTKDALQDFDGTKEIKEETGSCYDKTDTAAMTSLRTETGMLAIQQDNKPVEAFPADLEGPSPEATEPGLILSSRNIDKENLEVDKENLEETSSTSVCQLSDTEKENATIQNPHVSESGTNVAGENDSSLFLVEKGGEAATTEENFGEKSLDGEMAQINENIILTDVTEVCCKKADSIKHADAEFEIQDNQVIKDTSYEEDKEGSNQVENLKLELPDEESERRSASSASADQGNMGTLAVKVFDIPYDTTEVTEPGGEVSEIQAHEISAAYEDIKITDSKAAADDLEPEKHCDIATEAADTLKHEILHEEVFIGPGDADEHENLMTEHQVEENCNPNETVAVSPGNRAICEEAVSNAASKEHIEASYSTEKPKGGNLDVEEISNSKFDAQIQEVLHQEKPQEEENHGSVALTEHATDDSEKTKDLDTCYDKVDIAPKTSLTSTLSSCMAPKEEKPADDSGTGFDKELPKEVEIETSLLEEKFETQLAEKHLATDDENVERENVTAENPKADGLERRTIASEAVLGSKDPGTDVIDAMEETSAEELDVSESRSHCLELVHEADATSDQNTSAKELDVKIQTPVSALLQEEHKDEGKRDTQSVQETETVLFSSAAEAKEEIWQKENRQLEPPKVHSRGSETIQDDLSEKYNECCSTQDENRQLEPPKVHSRGSETIQDDLSEKYNECCSTQDEGLEPETQHETKCTDFPSDSEKAMGLASATESPEQGVCDDLVKSASQVKIQEEFNEPEDTGVEENQVHALARDLRAEEKGEETSKANETLQGENAVGQIVEQLEDIDSRPINQEITKGSCEEDEMHGEKFVEGKLHNTSHSEANELQYQEDESKHKAVDEDNAWEEFDKVLVEREIADKNSIDEPEGNISSEGATESEDQNSKAYSGTSTTDATTICNRESSVEKTRNGEDLGLEEAKETNPVLEQKEYASIAMPGMPVSEEACLSTAPDVILIEGNEDRSPAVKERIVETIQTSKANNVELEDPSKADLELKGVEYGGERTCGSDEKTSEEDMSKDTSVVSSSDLLNKIPEGNSPTTDPSSKERRPTDESNTVPPEEVKRDEERGEHDEEEVHERTELGHDALVMVEASQDIEVKVPHKKSHNILSGVGSKVKQSISKVKKAITGKSSHSKAQPPK